MLIAFAGLPSTGKTTIAQMVARKLLAFYVRVDTLEHAVRAPADSQGDVGTTGYMAAYAVPADNLRLRATVVADSVNALHATRCAWKDVATRAGSPFCEIELICSDVVMHRQRVEERGSDICGLRLPTWNEVVQRRYDPWQSEHLVIDTATTSAEQAAELVTRQVMTLFRSSAL